MTKKILLTGVTIAFAAVFAIAQPTDKTALNNEGVAYFGKFSTESERVSEKVRVYVSTEAHTKDKKKKFTSQKMLMAQIENTIRNVKGMQPFYKDASLRDGMVKAYTALLDSYKDDKYKKLMETTADEMETVEALETYYELQAAQNDKVNAQLDSLNQVKRAFASRHELNITFSEDAKSKEFFAKAKAVQAYKNKAYINVFRLRKAAAPIFDDMNKNGGKNMAKFIPILQKEAQDISKQMATFPAYEGDKALITAVQSLANFYAKECEKNMPDVATLFAKGKFDNQKEVDFVNKTTQNFVKKSNELNNEYYAAGDRFEDRHTPVYKGK